MKDLKEKTIRGGLARIVSQATTFSLRLGTMMALSRLLDPQDFGLVGMVTAVTGVLNLFKDFGLSTATVQRSTVTDEQVSTLFWINMAVGGVLGVLALGIAPVVATFYHEPRLYWVTMVLAAGFVFNAASVQHSVLLQRQMRFTALAVIDILALVISSAIGIGLAASGFKYWALVGMTVASPVVSAVGAWIAAGWVPGRPHRGVGIRSMMRFGGTLTLNGIVIYLAYNMEKVLLGRFWGADAVGIYGRAFQLASIPTDNLNSSVGGVAFSALSRLQDDPTRLRRYFLTGYTLVLALTLPITIIGGVFATDVIAVVLGPKWGEAAPIFRLLVPTILVLAIINPLGWLLFSIGRVERSLKLVLVLGPLVVAGYSLGLHYGPKGVAFAYSAVMVSWVVPHVAWCVHGTMISFRDIVMAVGRPLVSGLVAATVAFGAQFLYADLLAALPRLILGSSIAVVVYLTMLLYVMGQKNFYINIIRSLTKRTVVEEEVAVAV